MFPLIPAPELHIPTSEAAQLRSDMGEALMSLADAFGVGGDVWDVIVAAGGDTGPAAEDPTNQVRLWIVNVRDLALTQTASQTAVPENQWQLIAPGQPEVDFGASQRPLAEGDTIRSVADPQYVFTITNIVFNGVYSNGLVQ